MVILDALTTSIPATAAITQPDRQPFEITRWAHVRGQSMARAFTGVLAAGEAAAKASILPG
jgi:hypothetical protein